MKKEPNQPPQHNALALTRFADDISAQHGPVIQKRRLARQAGVADLRRSAKTMYKPWIGSRYDAREVFPATLILGESHYGADASQPGYTPEEKTIGCIRGQIGGWHFRFFTRVVAAFLGRLPSQEEKTAFWHSVAYHNLITSPLRGPRVPPSEEQWAFSLPTLSNVLSELRPDFVVALGYRMWWRIAVLDYLENIDSIYPAGMPPAKKVKGCSTVIVGIRHPSGRGFRWRDAHEHVEFGKNLSRTSRNEKA